MIALYVAGRVFEDFTSVSVTRSLEMTSSTFELSITENIYNEFPAYPGDNCQLRYGSDVVATGSIDRVNVSYSATSHTIQVSGRSSTKDLIDCSVEGAASYGSDKNPVDIIKLLVEPYGIKVKVENLSGIKPYKGQFQIKPEGESVWEAMHRLAELAQFTITDTASGELLLTRISKTTTKDSKNQLLKINGNPSTNILTGEFTEDETNSYSKVIVRGQSASAGTLGSKKPLNSQAIATDNNVKRNRVLIIPARSESTAADMQEAANYEAKKRSGQRMNWTYTVQGWKDKTLWQPGTSVSLQDDFLYAGSDNAKLLITEVNYSFSDSGTITTLTLNDFDAWEYEPIENTDATAKDHGTRDKKRKLKKLVDKKHLDDDRIISIDEYLKL